MNQRTLLFIFLMHAFSVFADEKIFIHSDISSGAIAKLEVKIDPDGSLKDIRILMSSGSFKFDEDAINAVKSRKYKPTITNGVAVSTTIPVVVVQQIKEP